MTNIDIYIAMRSKMCPVIKYMSINQYDDMSTNKQYMSHNMDTRVSQYMRYGRK